MYISADCQNQKNVALYLGVRRESQALANLEKRPLASNELLIGSSLREEALLPNTDTATVVT